MIGMIGFFRFFKTRHCAVCLLFLTLALITGRVCSMINIIYIRDGDRNIMEITTEKTLEQLMDDYEITLGPGDQLEYDGFSGRVAEINVTRSYLVSIKVDEQWRTLRTTGGTVEQLLDQAGIELGPEDIISKPVHHFTDPADIITINRVDMEKSYEQLEIEHDVIPRYTPLLSNGAVRQLSDGSNGARLLTYLHITIDGEVAETELISDDVTKSPVPEYTLVGDRSAVISPLSFPDYPVTNNVPSGYKFVLEGVKATGYSARAGARGASGNVLSAGHVAVNPNIVPYNSKLYITSADGKFVYGYAIASDTGTGLMDGSVGVDLYYETYIESVLNSARTVNVYVLE